MHPSGWKQQPHDDKTRSCSLQRGIPGDCSMSGHEIHELFLFPSFLGEFFRASWARGTPRAELGALTRNKWRIDATLNLLPSIQRLRSAEGFPWNDGWKSNKGFRARRGQGLVWLQSWHSPAVLAASAPWASQNLGVGKGTIQAGCTGIIRCGDSLERWSQVLSWF